MNRNPHVVVVVLSLVIAWSLSSGCGNDDPAAPETTKPTSVVISPSGGSVMATAQDGTVLSLEVPPGAVLANTEFVVTALEPAPGQWARFSIAPAIFFVKPIGVGVRMPTGWSPGARPRLSLDDSVLPTDYDGSQELTAVTHYLGYFQESTLLRSATTSASSSELVAADLDCSALAQSISDKIATAQNGGGVDEALFKQLVNEFGTLATDCPELAPSVSDFESALQQLACAEYDLAVADLQGGTPATSAQAIQAKVDQVVAAQGLKLQTSADCGSAEGFLADIEPVFTAYVQAKQDEFGSPDYVMELDTWDSLWQELKAVIAVAAQAACFSLTDAAALVETEVMVPLMTLFRDKAYGMCFGSSGTHAFLADLYAAGALMDHAIGDKLPTFVPFDEEDLERDIQYCASTLEINAYSNAGTLLESLQLQQDILDYQVENEASITVPVDGSVELGGLLRALKCYDVSPYPDVLEIRADFDVLDTLDPTSEGILLAQPYSVDIAEVVELLQLEADGSFELLIRRLDVCDDFLGMSDSYSLFTIDVTIEGCPPPIPGRAARSDQCTPGEISVEILGMPDRFPVGEPVELTIQASVVPGAEVVSVENLPVNITVENGQASPDEGFLDGAGIWKTQVTMNEGHNEILIGAVVASGSVEGEASVTRIRPDQIELLAREVEIDAAASSGSRVSPDDLFERVIESREDIQRFDFEPFDFSLTRGGTGTMAGMPHEATTTVSAISEIQMLDAEFHGVTFSASGESFATLSNPNFTIDEYNVRASAYSYTSVEFIVWGEPAAFSISGTQDGGEYQVYLSGPADILECDSAGSPCASLDASGSLAPGEYSLYVDFAASVEIEWEQGCEACPTTSGSHTATGTIEVEFTVQHQDVP